MSLGPCLVVERTGTIDGIAEGINDAAKKFNSDWNVDDGSSSLDNIAFLDQLVIAFIIKKESVKIEIEENFYLLRIEITRNCQLSLR